MDPLDALVLFTAGNMARRTLIVDSSHHTCTTEYNFVNNRQI